jgi:ribosomal protein S18 acetylase RimI-like enzyme
VTGPDPRPILRLLAAQFVAAVADGGSEVHAVPGFRVHLWPSPDPFYRNVAVPTDPRCVEPEAVAGMLDAFARRRRVPRLEFFAELWPGLPASLEAAGLAPERRGEVMVARATGGGDSRRGAGPPAARLLRAGTPARELAAFLDGAASVFGEGVGLAARGEVERLADGLRRGTTLASVVDGAAGRPLAGASLVRAGAVGELVAVWCLPGHRRHGHAGAACAAVLAGFFAAGGEVAWLSADGEAGRLYRRLGFAACGTQLNYAGPAP